MMELDTGMDLKIYLQEIQIIMDLKSLACLLIIFSGLKSSTLWPKNHKKKIIFFFLFIYLKLSHFLKNVRNSPDHANGVMSMH